MLLEERLAEARRAAAEIDPEHGGGPRTTSELAARSAAVLLPATSLVRREAPESR
jgi:hypothetical protein